MRASSLRNVVPENELEEERSDGTLRRFLAAVLVGLIATVIGYAALRPAPGSPGASGEAPEFELPFLSGNGTLSSDELRGKPVVLSFWASWCPPCREEAELLEAVSQDYAGEITVVGINTRDTEPEARAFVEEFDLTYPLLRDTGSDLFNELGFIGLPQTLFVTSSWKLQDQANPSPAGTPVAGTAVLGAISEADLRAHIEALIAER
ncbi:MAG TPA: TlpA disulfide reductase family protein [Actinomycetota bacterium]|nr:TlpA disulfide reductase family protein [Actinomycetota bacterium]